MTDVTFADPENHIFLASDEADFIAGVSLPMDGGILVDIAPGRRT
jgi:hypothetical protein